LDPAQRLGHLGVEPAGVAVRAVRHHVAAHLGRDREAGRHRQAERRHLGEVGALAAEQGLVGRAALGRAAAELADVLHDPPPSWRKSAIGATGSWIRDSSDNRFSRSTGSGSITMTPPRSKNAATSGLSSASTAKLSRYWWCSSARDRRSWRSMNAFHSRASAPL